MDDQTLNQYAPYFMVAFFLLFSLMWFFVITFLRNMANMEKALSVELGDIIQTSKWGSGKVNGVSMQKCLRVIRCANGFILETQRIFGGGKLWIPKETLKIEERVSKKFLRPKKIKISSGENTILLLGNLADEII